jgi:hypothetical protein
VKSLEQVKTFLKENLGVADFKSFAIGIAIGVALILVYKR